MPMLHSIDGSASSGVSVLVQEYPSAPSLQVTVESAEHEEAGVNVTVGAVTVAEAVHPAWMKANAKSPRATNQEIRMR